MVEFCDTWTEATAGRSIVIGREGDVAIDDNPYLHRTFLHVTFDRLWWLGNIGAKLTATVSDGDGAVQAWLAPGGALPLVFARTDVRFTAGPTSYSLSIHLAEAPLTVTGVVATGAGSTTTMSPVELTLNQRLLVLSLAEPSLRSGATAPSDLPSSKQAAARLRWAATKFNRQLDTVCQKLSRTGVRGLHGATHSLASNRKARLVEYALATRLVTADDLPLLDALVTDDRR